MRQAARIAVVALVALLVLPLLAGAAFAISPAQECEQAGGTFTKVRGTQTCTVVEVPGNNQGGVTKETDVSQKGSSRSAHPEEEQFCVENKGGTHCPQGQQT